MRTEAEIRSALVHLLLATMKRHTEVQDMDIIRTLAWVLKIGSATFSSVSVRKPHVKAKRVKVASDHFAI